MTIRENPKTRPGSVGVATAAQCSAGVAYAGIAMISLLLPCRPTNEAEALGCVGLAMAQPLEFTLLAIGLIALCGAFGMWRGKVWGWWTSLLVDAVTSCWFAHETDGDYWYVLSVLLAFIPLGLLFLPNVWKFYLARRNQTVPD